MKKLNILRLLSTVAIAAAGVFGIASVKEGKKAESVGAAGTKRIFLDCTQHSDYDNVQSIGIQYYTGSYIKKECTKLADNYWYVDVPSTNLTKVQFFRCDKGNVNNNYNWQWEGNPSAVNYYSVKGWDNNGDWSNAAGADESYETASTTPSTTTKRIWADPKDNFFEGAARAALRVFNGNTHYKTYILGGSTQFCVVAGQYLFYVDIPVNYDCQLVRLHNAFNTIWTYGGNFSEISGFNTAQVVYSWDTAASYSNGNEETATVEYSKAVLDGYSTCLSSASNGYGNIENINTQVINKLSSSDLSNLRNSTFSSSGYGTKTYGDKIDLMVSLSSGGHSSGSPLFGVLNQNSNSIIIITIISVVSVGAIGGYFFVRKRREN